MGTLEMDSQETRLIKKYKYLDEKYGESLEYNKSFLDRVLDNMED